jgi:hypothetical protein
MTNFYLSTLKDHVMENGRVNMTKLFRALNDEGFSLKISPEVRKMLLGNDKDILVRKLEKFWNANEKFFINHSNTTAAKIGFDMLLSPIQTLITNMKDGAVFHAHYPNNMQIMKVFGRTLKTIDNAMDSAINGKIAAGVRIGVNAVAREMESQERMEKRQKVITDFAANPDKFMEHVAKVTENIEDENLKMHIQSKMFATQQYLYETMPKSRIKENFGPSPKYIPSDNEMAKWNRTIMAANNPLMILKDVQNGVLTKESVDTVKHLYPDIHSIMASVAIAKLGKLKKPLTMQQKMQVSTLMGVAPSTSMDKGYMKMLSQNNQQQMKDMPHSRNVNFGLSGRMGSSTNKLLSR